MKKSTPTRSPETSKVSEQKKPQLSGLLKPYTRFIVALIILALASNGLNLLIPKIIAHGIDSYTIGGFDLHALLVQFFAAAFGIFFLTVIQSAVQTYASERVARDLREQLADKISRQSYAYIQTVSPAKLLTNLTSDIDSIKLFVSQAIVSITSSIVIIGGAAILLLMINWRLALAVLAIIPIIGGTFFFVLSKVRPLFVKTREVVDWLNKVINESILGSALIRVLNSQQLEYEKFLAANGQAKDIGLTILKMFAGLIPIITFVANLAMLVILMLGGRFVIGDTMTLGEFAAFNGYIALLIFPILVIGFMSNVIAQAAASYGRIAEVLETNEREERGTVEVVLRGDVALKNVSLAFGEKMALKDVSFTVKAGTKTAIIGPTAGGKTQLLYLLTALIQPSSGVIEYDGKDANLYDKTSLHQQVGFVFQDSVMFNLTLRENIAFSDTVDDSDLTKAIQAAELQDFIETLPDGLNTIVSERGTSLSGGQKQ